MKTSLNKLYTTLGVSKQAVFQNKKQQDVFEKNFSQLIDSVDLIRAHHPGCGLEKLYYSIEPDFIGRDNFIEFFMELGYRVKRPKNYRRTTYSSDKFYPNLINGLQIGSFGAVWQTDITYIEVGQKFYYAVYIIDIFTRVIVGYNISRTLKAESNLTALAMAVKKYNYPKIHHSDRGSQYTCTKYTTMLETHGSKVSMGKCAQENAYAERINLTIKDEYLKYKKMETYEDLVTINRKAVAHYNSKRLHNNLGRLTPNCYLEKLLKNEIKPKPILIIHDYENNKPNGKSTNKI
jgi:putative transposase